MEWQKNQKYLVLKEFFKKLKWNINAIIRPTIKEKNYLDQHRRDQ